MTAAPTRRRSRLGLRSRVTASFAAGAALLSGVLAGATYALAGHYLLDQRQSSAVNQAYADARLIKQDLTATSTNVAEVLSSLTPAQETRSLLYRHGHWFSTSVSVGHSVLPADLISAVLEGAPVRQRITTAGGPAVVVGIPLPAVGADYYEVHSLSELARTLDLLALVLAISGVVTTAGGALVGRWASGRLVRPLTEVVQVATAISHGSLDQRLAADDPDLDPLVVSFNEMVDALQHRIERDARFASDVSHELRSPLTTVQTSVELLQKFNRALPADGRRTLDLLGKEIGRFSAMVQDLLEISRLDAGAAGLDLEETPLDELVLDTVNGYSRGTVPVRVLPGGEAATVRADRRRLQRVIINLLDNARLHGGGAVMVSLDGDSSGVWFEVDDSGPGVAPSERPRIFERFYRGPAAGQREDSTGTGLGLALVAEHVKAHHGTVTVEDRPGGGARFIVRLPVARP
ncbi:MAG TPA: HAMP domain-containing sensor histidine kinase [Acidimicrobiales bacterium]|nr:HAMP domain-containing sensor histidine kinase [Acidimicrobiales bacterium]